MKAFIYVRIVTEFETLCGRVYKKDPYHTIHSYNLTRSTPTNVELLLDIRLYTSNQLLHFMHGVLLSTVRSQEKEEEERVFGAGEGGGEGDS